MLLKVFQFHKISKGQKRSRKREKYEEWENLLDSAKKKKIKDDIKEKREKKSTSPLLMEKRANNSKYYHHSLSFLGSSILGAYPSRIWLKKLEKTLIAGWVELLKLTNSHGKQIKLNLCGSELICQLINH